MLRHNLIQALVMFAVFSCADERASNEPPPVARDGGANAGDVTPPRLVSTAPAEGAADVGLSAPVVFTFDEALDCAAVGGSMVFIQSPGPSYGTTSCAGATLTFVPDSTMSSGAAHELWVLSGVPDLAGNITTEIFKLRFTTATQVDTTPPVAPQITSVVPPTTLVAALTLDGTKEAGANVEGSWRVDGVEQNTFVEIVARDAAPTWQHAFGLQDGINVYVLRSVDAAGNVSSTVSFTTTKEPNEQPVALPTVDYFPTTTAVQMVLSGTKPADTSIRIGGVQAVPVGPDTTWDYEVDLLAGNNRFAVSAADAFGNVSADVEVQIARGAATPVPASAQLSVELELKDMWNVIGDEFLITRQLVEINHFGVHVWIEGPYSFDSNRAEGCFFDEARMQRKHTRYVTTVFETKHGGASQLWFFPNFRVPNLEAALTEHGAWANTSAPIPRNADRRDASGNRNYYEGPPPCGPYAWNRMGVCRSRMTLGGPVDAVTSATLGPRYDRETGRTLEGVPLGDWSQPVRIDWDMRDDNGARVARGMYLVNIVIVVDRSIPTQGPGELTNTGNATVPPYQWLQVLSTDHETCWDRATDNSRGPHRAEGTLVFDDVAHDVYWQEKGAAELVDAPHNEREGIRFNGQCDWDGSDPGDTFASAPHCPPPSSDVGSRVEYLGVPPGYSAPVRVRYCPAGCN